MSGTSTVINLDQRHGCLVQVLWFVFVGWWLGQLWIAAAWILMLTVVGIPFGVMMLNRIPQVMALRGDRQTIVVTQFGGRTVVSNVNLPQVNILVRALYFVLVGWWLSAIVMEVAYVCCLTVVGLPLGFWLFDAVPALVSLHR
jgi:uncharacterized membrane protein YccF (DUF307 family)